MESLLAVGKTRRCALLESTEVRLARSLTKAYRSELERTVGAHRRTRIICTFRDAIRKCRRTGVTTNLLAPQANCPGRRWHGTCEQGFDGRVHCLRRPGA